MPTILVVEDDAPLQYAITALAEAAGYETIAVSSTMAALNVLDSSRQIDLLLSDVVMPKGQPNGFALVRMARMKRLGIKALLMTGYTDLSMSRDTFPAKVVHKPIDDDDLMRAISDELAAD